MKKYKITIAAAILATSATTLANSFNPAAFAAQQLMTMQLEQHTYDTVANQSISDLQAFLKKNGMNSNSSGKSNNDKSPFKSSAPAPSYHAPIYHPPEPQSTPEAPTSTTNKTKTQGNTNNLPLNTNGKEKTSNWNYKL